MRIRRIYCKASQRDQSVHILVSPVLGGVVLVFILHHQPLAGEVVGLSLAPPAELDLEPLEVSLVLDDLDERHGYF